MLIKNPDKKREKDNHSSGLNSKEFGVFGSALNRYKLDRIAKRQKKIYEPRVDKFQKHHEIAHWTTERGQLTRFSVLSSGIDLNKKVIADVGCGVGDFFRYLKNQNVCASMHGFDITKSFIEYASSEHPDCWFSEVDVAVEGLPRKYDYVFSSGIFAFGDRYFFNTVTKNCFDNAVKEYRFNMFRTSSKDFWSIPIEDAVEHCYKLGASDVRVETGYLGKDYTVYLIK